MSLADKVGRRSIADILLAAEALLWLTLFRVCLAAVPVRKIIRSITHESQMTGNSPNPSEAVPACVFRVRWAVEAVARNSPIAFVCFPQTLAGYTMLRLRGIQTTMVYGVARSPEGELIAHTWLCVGERTLLGGEGADAFNPIERWT